MGFSSEPRGLSINLEAIWRTAPGVRAADPVAPGAAGEGVPSQV